MLRSPFSLLLAGITLMLFLACDRSAGPAELPEEAKAYISGYSSGILSKTGPVRIRFTQSPIAPEEVGSEVEASILQFSPRASGRLYWEDNRTIRFDPDPHLEGSQAYQATLQLDRLFPEAPRSARRVNFNFDTRDQDFEIEFTGLFPASLDEPESQEIRGVLYSADLAEAASVESVLQANQAGEELDIQWEHSADKILHRFSIRNIRRGPESGRVELSWNGRSMEVDRSGSRSFKIPALDEFWITQARVLQAPEQALVLQFSDPLRSNQDLSGLVRLEGYQGNLRFRVDGTELYVYPSGKLSGTYEVKASAGILNSRGDRMKEPSSWTVALTMPDPAVRLVGKGVIMPESEGLIFPFEAVGLQAVLVEIFKIYDNNILQFLQTNNLDGEDELFRVGQLILQQKVDLRLLNPTAESTSWGRYALDLSELFQQDRDAIYQVRIGFKPAYAQYPCANNYAGQEEELTTANPSSEELQSMLENWYGFEGYYSGYEWEDRENPCKPAYYNYEKFIRRNVLTSNLGIIAKGNDRNEFQVTVNDLRTTQPVAGSIVTFYNYYQQLIGSGETGTDGTLSLKLDEKPFVAVASRASDKGYLRLNDGNALSLSRFDVDGTQAQKGMKGFLYTERGAWRPGDSVFLNFILESTTQSLPKNYPITLELYNARNQLVERRNVISHVNHVYDLSFSTQKNDPTGIWRAEVKAGGAVFNKSLMIETIKPNRLQVDLDFGGESIQLASSGRARAELTARWLHGAPASALEAVVESQVQSKNTRFPKYSNFEFDDPTRRVAGQSQVIYKGILDNNGRAAFQTDFLPRTLPSGKMTARLRTRVMEKGGDFSTALQSLEISAFQAYVGLGLPENEYRQKRIPLQQTGEVKLVVVDQEGNPLPNRNLTGEVYRVEWRWWWERNPNNISTYNYNRNLEEQLSATLRTNAEGEASWNLELANWGRYLVRVCDEQSGHCTGDFLYVGYPYGDDDVRPDDAALLAFTTEKEVYQVGEEVSLKIPAEENSRALISLETGADILETQWVDLEPGENTYRFQARPEMAPNIYAHVTLVQEHGQVKNDRPIRLYGVLPIPIEDPETRLEPIIRMPEELRPETDFTLEVSENQGKPMTYTLAVVDEGLLGLTGFKTPNPHDAFYAKEALGIRTWDVYDQVLGAYGGQLDRILSVGGDGSDEVNPEQEEANRFEPVVLHLGPFQLKKGQKAKHQLNMPNYVGAVRTMVIAAADGAYGAGEKKVPVRKPLMVLTTLPRVLGPGEEIRIPVNVFAMKEQVRDVSLTVRETSGGVDVVTSRQQVRFDVPGSQVVYFDAKVGTGTGRATFRIEASGNGEQTSQEIEVQIRNPNSVQTETVVASLQAGERWEENLSPIGMPGSREAYLEVSTLPPMNLGERLDYLIQYPYGCVEQSVSAGFPQLYAGRMLDLNPVEAEEMKKNVQATIRRLLDFQTAAGGFAYWPGNSEPDLWATSYAGHFLLEARSLGYSVPGGLLERFLDFQKKASRLWEPDNRPPELGYGNRKGEEELIQAYRLYTLAHADQPDMAGMNRLREQQDLSVQAGWRLAAAYALAGKKEVANRLISGRPAEAAPYSGISRTYGSAQRDLAMILETRILLEQENEAADLAFRLAEELGKSRWYSTQTTAYGLLAIGKLLGTQGAQKEISFAYSIGQGGQQNKGSNHPVSRIDIPQEQLQGQVPIRLENKGKGLLFARLVSRGKPLWGEETPNASGLSLQVNYLDLNGKPIDPTRLDQGSDLIAKVVVTHTGDRPYPIEHIALDQIFPSGWEILNSRMAGMSQYQNSSSDYQDIRDDRVYTFFGLSPGNSVTYYVQLNAAYQGRFYLPGVHCEAMYDNRIRAQQAGRWVTVGQAGGI